MATINPTIQKDFISDDGSVVLATWTPVTESDTCQAVEFSQYPDRCMQVVGTFGGATAILQGSNDGTNWFPIKNVQGTALSMAAAGGQQAAEGPRFMRPSASGGAAQSLTFTLFMRRSNTMRT